MSKSINKCNKPSPGKLASGMEDAYYRREIESLQARLLESEVKNRADRGVSASGETDSADRAWRLLEKPVRDLDWHHLETIGRELGKEVVDDLEAEIFNEAKSDLESGRAAASAVLQGLSVKPFDHARYLELRSSVIADWQPRPGIESILVDHLVQAQWAFEHWMSTHMALSTIPQLPASDTYAAAQAYGAQMPKLQNSADAESHSLHMATRWQDQVLRIIRNLREIRKISPVIVQNASQVNVGQQQVNVAMPNANSSR